MKRTLRSTSLLIIAGALGYRLGIRGAQSSAWDGNAGLAEPGAEVQYTRLEPAPHGFRPGYSVSAQR